MNGRIGAEPREAILPHLTLVLGGARSGKSGYAECLVLSDYPAASYIATGQAWDEEMVARIADHRSRRGDAWTTIEEPLDLVGALNRAEQTRQPVLVDCLTLWLSNMLLAEHDLERGSDRLLGRLPELHNKIVLVSNEVGLGIVPDNALARRFRDAAGRLHQSIAAIADRVVFIAAGLPLILK